MPTQKQIMDAASELERLTVLAKQMVMDLRSNADGTEYGKEMSYAMLYDLRWRIGKILEPLGFGLPKRLLDIRALNDRLMKEG